jgi:putative acetyltransferase
VTRTARDYLSPHPEEPRSGVSKDAPEVGGNTPNTAPGGEARFSRALEHPSRRAFGAPQDEGRGDRKRQQNYQPSSQDEVRGGDIRDATEADIPALARVAARSYAHAFATILEPDALARYGEAYFAMRFAERWPVARVAKADGELLAFCVMSWGTAPPTDLKEGEREPTGVAPKSHGHIDMLFADPAAIGSGVGAALLADAEARGARSLECFEANNAARRFYERHGWRVTRAYAREFAGRERRFVWMEKVSPDFSSSAPMD